MISSLFLFSSSLLFDVTKMTSPESASVFPVILTLAFHDWPKSTIVCSPLSPLLHSLHTMKYETSVDREKEIQARRDHARPECGMRMKKWVFCTLISVNHTSGIKKTENRFALSCGNSNSGIITTVTKSVICESAQSMVIFFAFFSAAYCVLWYRLSRDVRQTIITTVPHIARKSEENETQ